MRTYAELKEADFQGMTDEEDSFVKRITNIEKQLYIPQNRVSNGGI